MKKPLRIKISGMTCVMCSRAVEQALSRVNGVSSAKVNLADESVTMVYDPSHASFPDIERAVKDAGYSGCPRCIITSRKLECMKPKL